VDAVSIGRFGERERDNLYTLWNRMSSRSYFPGPVRGWLLSVSTSPCSLPIGILSQAPDVGL
jgi:hypothetical protein